jgi:hypothetical protein
MKPKEILIKVQEINQKMYDENLIEKIEFRKNLKVVIKAIRGDLNLSNNQYSFVETTLKKRLCVTKLRLCMFLLQINFN